MPIPPWTMADIVDLLEAREETAAARWSGRRSTSPSLPLVVNRPMLPSPPPESRPREPGGARRRFSSRAGFPPAGGDNRRSWAILSDFRPAQNRRSAAFGRLEVFGYGVNRPECRHIPAAWRRPRRAASRSRAGPACAGSRTNAT